MNRKNHRDKVPIQNLFHLWIIITAVIFCDIPYMLARFMGRKMTNSRPGSPNTGGYLVTRLARSYGILSPNFIRNLTRFLDNELTIPVLSVMRVVVNMGGGFVIPLEDIKQPIEEQGRNNGHEEGVM